MLKLDIMTESELGQIFGTLDALIPLHEGKTSKLSYVNSICDSVYLRLSFIYIGIHFNQSLRVFSWLRSSESA